MADEKTYSPELNSQQDIYQNSDIVTQLSERINAGLSPRIAFLDIDSCMTGTPEDQKAAHDALIQAGFMIVWVTSRTPEMTMTRADYEATPHMRRPIPQLLEGTNLAAIIMDERRDENHKYEQAFPEEVPSFTGIYGGVGVAGSTGSEIYMRQKGGGYLFDADFEARMRVQAETWGVATHSLVDRVNERMVELYPQLGIATLAPIEDWENYQRGDVDVAPPTLRLQVNFKTFEAQEAFQTILGEIQTEIRPDAGPDGLYREEKRHPWSSVHVIEDGNPEKARYQVYLTPQGASKVDAVTHIFAQIQEALKARGITLSPEQFDILFAGDSWPDVPMGTEGPVGSLLLVGGSRMTQFVGDLRADDAATHFASVDIRGLNAAIIPQPEQGHYILPGNRTIILGDEAFHGTKAPQTILRYVQEKYGEEVA